jgi:hypothetical protein
MQALFACMRGIAYSRDMVVDACWLAGWLAGWPDHAQELIDVYCN